MEATAIRTCQRDGCENDLDDVNGRRLKSTAKFCSPECRREHNRAHGDGQPDRKWVPGYWRKLPQKRSTARRRQPKADPVLTLICAALLCNAGQAQAQDVR